MFVLSFVAVLAFVGVPDASAQSLTMSRPSRGARRTLLPTPRVRP